MAERIVDLFEAVEVDEQHRQRAESLARFQHRGFQQLQEIYAVRETGERIMPRLKN